MSKQSRQRQIIEQLACNGKTRVDDLVCLCKAAPATIRSDLRELEKQGVIARCYGSAELINNDDRPLDEKQYLNTVTKNTIAKTAAQFIEDGDSIILDCGSTTLCIVPYLSEIRQLTLMTNSIYIAEAISEVNEECNVIMSGGTCRKKSASFHGTLAEENIRKFTFDKLFIGADGFDLEFGLTTYNEAYHVSQVMCHSADKVCVVIDSSKLGRKTPNVVIPKEGIHMLITDSGITKEQASIITKSGIELVITQ